MRELLFMPSAARSLVPQVFVASVLDGPRPRVSESPVNAADDSVLALALARREPHAQRAAWDRFYPVVRRILRRTLGPWNDVEDHVQETFLLFFRGIGTLRDPAKLRSFLVGIAVNVAKSSLRRSRVRRWLHLADGDIVLEDLALEQDEASREALARLYTMLDRLSVEARLALVLRHLEGLELTEVAAALDLSLATTKRRLAKAMDQLLAMASHDEVLSLWVQAPSDGKVQEESHVSVG